MNILELPHTCISAIFKYLDHTQLAVLRATAKAFHPYICILIKSKSKPTIEDWVRYGSFDIIKLLKKNIELASQLAKYGHLNILKWAKENGCPWDSWTCANAAYGGHFELLKYARENGCPWDSWTCETAAYRGHLEILEYAIKNGCPWVTCPWKNTITFTNSASIGSLDIFKWVRENGWPWDM